MLALTTVVAIAVSCSVVFMVSAVVITIAWVKIRQERLSLALAKSRQGPYGNRGLPNYPAETLTELSREEGSALRQYGQLPYGRPTEWGLLASRESLVQNAGDKETSIPLPEKPPTLPLLKTRSFKSKRQVKAFAGLKHPSSLTTLTETCEGSPRVSISKDEVLLSAVDGVMELPTETTPRQTPEREDEQPKADTTMRPISGAWPMAHRRDRSATLFPVFEDHYEAFDPTNTRVRGGSIASQTAGTVPEQPIPPPPCAYPPNRFRLSKNDSMRFSTLSFETADSSILDDSRRTSTNADTNLASPALPPCPTFVPFSANDVGRMEYDRNNFSPAVPGAFTFPSTSPSYESQRLEPERTSPRRSLTARSPSHSPERISPPPRRSESLHTKQSSGEPAPPYLDLNRIPPLSTVGCNTGLLPHFSQMQRHSMHGSPRRENDPFYSGTANSHNLTNPPRGPGRRASSFYGQETGLQTASVHSRPPLTSAMKGGSGPRKGHKRQNCVRISIHPPITFGGPSFSPMVEEPEEPEEREEFALRRSEISDLSTSNISRNSSVSALSTSRNSLLDFPRERPYSRIMELPDEGHTGQVSNPSKRKKQAQLDSENGNPSVDKTLPGILTILPTTKIDEGTLSQTPSPERNPTVWMVSDYNGSPTRIENSPAPGSPRRSAVMGPRSQPGRQSRNSYQSLVSPIEDPRRSGSPDRPPRAHSIRSPPGRPVDSLRRAKSEARVLPVSQSPAQAKQAPFSSQNGIIVPIWEDRNQGPPAARKSTISLVNEPVELHGDTSPRAIERPRSRNQADRMSRMSSYSRKPRHDFATPTKKTLGLGIGAATPGSLYDGDGFLKE